MMIPVRCFSCNTLIGDKYYKFIEMVKAGEDPKKALDTLSVKRYCCQRMLLSHTDVIDLFLSLQEGS